jgi:spore maturation protein CgeB
MFSSRAVTRLFRSRMVKEFNNRIIDIADNFGPDIFVAFKGNYIYANTLQLLSRRGIPLYNFYPDTSAFAHGKWLPRSLPEYDCIFYTKAFWYADVTRHIKLKDGSLLQHGYNPSLHRPVELDARDISEFGCDVSFIATHTHYKEKLLERLCSIRPDLNLRIWGNGWTDRCKSTELKRWIKGFALTGELFVGAIRASKINLAIMSGRVEGARSGDLTTSRTYQIPASGGFMLHERNSEVLDLYRENEEIACFESVEELAGKIDYYLAHPAEREGIALAGHARCVPAYSYDNRMAEILRWDHQHRSITHAEVTVTTI